MWPEPVPVALAGAALKAASVQISTPREAATISQVGDLTCSQTIRGGSRLDCETQGSISLPTLGSDRNL